MNIEKKRIERWLTRKGNIGHIKLDRLAIPETVKVTVLGEEIIPESFNIYGSPNFTDEQERMYSFKEDEIKRQNGGKYIPLEAKISYEERIFDVPQESFDTISGIKESLKSLEDLNEVLQNRSLFCKAHRGGFLNEFIIFGCYQLDCSGQIWAIRKSSNEKLNFKEDVELYSDFQRNNSDGFVMEMEGYVIPEAGSKCLCCGKLFTIDDLKNNPCVYRDEKVYHDSCWRKYRQIVEIDKFTNCLMSLIYKETDYQYELIPNGYCNQDCCSHIPWFLFHTIDGDIKMGWRKRVISIEWQENYKTFDVDLFKDENVTKWEKDGKRGIHAWGKEKAYEYLSKVVQHVNPEYSIW